MDYPCVKFGEFSFSRFNFTVRQAGRQTDRQNHTQTRMIAILTRLPSALVMNVSDIYIATVNAATQQKKSSRQLAILLPAKIHCIRYYSHG